MRGVQEIRDEWHAEDQPLTAAGLRLVIRVPEGFRVELVAPKILVQDPINIAFAPDGSVCGSVRNGRLSPW